MKTKRERTKKRKEERGEEEGNGTPIERASGKKTHNTEHNRNEKTARSENEKNQQNKDCNEDERETNICTDKQHKAQKINTRIHPNTTSTRD